MLRVVILRIGKSRLAEKYAEDKIFLPFYFAALVFLREISV